MAAILVTKKAKKTTKVAKPSSSAQQVKKLQKKDAAVKNTQTVHRNEDLFNLAEVLSIGGEKEDYERLLSIDENEEVEVNGEDPVGIAGLKNELQSFIQNLGLDKPHLANVKTEKQVDNDDIDNKKLETAKEDEDVNFENLFSALSKQKHKNCLLKNCVPWYDHVVNLPKNPCSYKSKEIEEIQTLATQYWHTDVELYQTAKDVDKSSDSQWLRTVLKSGTQSDRVAALTMLTQESPIHCMRSLETLMNMAKKKARREALIAVDSLRHIWVADLLPDVKLRTIDQYPLQKLKVLCKDGRKDSQIQLLISMVFEQKLKSVYTDYIDIIQNLSKDPLVNIRNKILGIIYELLVMKPEQEQKLLSLLVNKLGDPDKKVASKSSYLMSQLIIKHPNMKTIIIEEVERMIFRPNVSEKSQYYAICFLNQIALSHQAKNVASKLISIYFSFFKVLATRHRNDKKNLDSQQSKLLSGLLTGVNRAFPYAEGDEAKYDEQLNTLFRLTHMNHLGTSIQAFMLIYQVMESRQSVSDRYYQALYQKLLDPEIKNSSRHTMLLNLLFKSMKNDPTLKRVKSFVKRLLQLCSQEQPSFSCGVLFLLSEIIKLKPGVKSMIEQMEEDDEEEHFKDVDISDDEVIKNKESDSEDAEGLEEDASIFTGPSWTFIKRDIKSENYNISHRNPLYAGAEFSCTWEVVPLLKHYHPSVQHFGSSVLQGETIQYKGDPLQDFTLMRFLDRFMYRNPKKKEVEHGSSLMQPKESSARLKEEPVNSKLFLQKPEEKIRQDEVFFYRYFKQKEATTHKIKTEGVDQSDDELDVAENMYDIDFATEMKKNKNVKKKTKSEEDDSSENEDGEDDFDYDDMEQESDEDFDDDLPQEKGDKFTDKDYENALFENLNSDGESFDGEDSNGNDDLSNENLDSMFAAADEFAHLLEDDNDDEKTGVHPKQQRWEERHEKKHWKSKQDNNKIKQFTGKRKFSDQKNYSRRKQMKKR